ncbi:putative E3 ubiquitin-protein ligase HERC1 [Halotydeus destructor]|nr:putative E3 ubiquitin-protein ligase HERC1 [Halotydeus destructor]
MSSSHGLDNDDLDDFDFFVTLAETSTETAENFARMKKLNVSLMYEKVADKYLKDRDYRSALKFNFLSKTPQLERISNFSLLGFYEEVANYVQLLFNTKCGEINEADRIHFATLAINCFVDMYRENRDDSHRIVQDLRKFLKENMYYDERIAIRLFLNEELFDLAAFCAKQRFNYVALVEALLGPDSLEYSTSSMQQNEAVLESEDYLFSNESYLECLISPQLVNAFLAKPTLTGRYLRFLTKRLPTLNAKTLNMVAVRLAPCNPLVQLVLHRVLPRMQQQYLSATDVEFVTKKDFLNFYTFVLLMISHGQGPKYSRKLVTSLEEIKSEKMRSPSGTENSKVLSDGVYAGQAHAAAIKSGVLYTWGESRFGRLGYAVDDFQQTFALPSPVTFFTDNVAIAVKSVSCGSKHTLILTDFGVYSCGAGSHGQLGLGEEIQFVQSPALVIRSSKSQHRQNCLRPVPFLCIDRRWARL